MTTKETAKKSVKKTTPSKKSISKAKSSTKKSKKTTEYPTVPLDFAIECTQLWCNFNEGLHIQYNLTKDYIRAFFIPKEDIFAMNDKLRSEGLAMYSGCRVYLGMQADPEQIVVDEPLMPPTPGPMKLFMVAVEHDGTLAGHDVTKEGDKSLVYDFSVPCPSTCDMVSDLYHPGSGSVHPTIKKTVKKTKKN